MMSSVAEMMIGVVELLEQESVSLRRRASKTVIGFALKLGAVVLLIVGMVWLGWAGFSQLSTMLSEPLAALISGILMFILAGGLLWFSDRP
jgi:protein-S-isoprenylcysteine O-methyltransferase Ste14